MISPRFLSPFAKNGFRSSRSEGFFDTSVLVAAMVEAHPAHGPAWAWLDRALRGEVEGGVATHTLAELFAVLTRLPVVPRIAPREALRLVEVNLEGFFIVALETQDYLRALNRLAALGLSGGAVYDALIAEAALKAGVERLLTLNRRHFVRLGEEIRAIVEVPA